METILATVTVISLALAACMGVLLARLVREERRRSDARVALLTGLAATDEPVAAVSLNDLHFREDDPIPAASTPGTLFAEDDARSAWPLRLVAAAGVTLVIAGVVLGVQSLPGAEDQATSEQVVAAEATAPLELLSLGHRQQNGELTISGVVQNPRGAKALSGIEAAVLAFDGKGRQVAAARAPVDFSTLSPGQESPFLVRVKSTNVARYRVSFKGEGDQPIAHVDRRTLDSVARKEVP